MNAVKGSNLTIINKRPRLIGGLLILAYSLIALFYFSHSDAKAPQALPHSKITIETSGGDVQLSAQIARTVEEKRIGLMYRKQPLSLNEGMLFLFSSPAIQTFWMENTYISLDILFIDKEGKIVTMYETARPLDRTPLKSKGPVTAVLELRGGAAKALGIHLGDRVNAALF